MASSTPKGPGSSAPRICFGTCELDLEAYELRRNGQSQPIEPQVFDLLAYLAQHPGRLITKDELIEQVWRGRIVSDAALSSRIKSARRAIGDDGEHQRLIRTVHGRGFRFAAELAASEPMPAVPNEAPPPAPTAMGSPAGRDPELPSGAQEIRFCRTTDGVRLAYSQIGAGPPLVKTGNWLTHLEYDLQSPIWRHLYRELSRDHTLVRYDARGNGLSDREIEVSLEAFVTDLEAVVDAAGLEEFSLFGISQGCAVSVAYAVRHPDRVRHLILYGGYAEGWNKRSRTALESEQYAAMLTLIRVGWGQEHATFRQLFTSEFIPGGTKEQADWFNELQRISTSPADAVRNQQACGDIDVTGLLSKVTSPTLVMHARDDACVPFEQGRRLAAGIPGARFVTLQSRNHLILESEPAFSCFLHEIRSFLGG
ncbi:MAG: alpha/beta fold hydrolase [Proteobacteria bacterium]|nr:alpha/beta fold hydrolase [Pseudomonadota bacterium]MBI3500119.1 alpha/beta fold hydrolase [Pseudomonadota bacterium]